MSRPALLLFASLAAIAALGACARKHPAPPEPKALGAELATFPQVLLPLSPDTMRDFKAAADTAGFAAAAKGVWPAYALASAAVDGSTATLFVAYATPWQAPKGIALQPVSIQQFLRAFSAEGRAGVAMVVAPKGTMFFTREQMHEVGAGAEAAGGSSADLPFSFLVGSGR